MVDKIPLNKNSRHVGMWGIERTFAVAREFEMS